MNEDRPIILFDGVCNFCNSSVDFIVARDPEGVFRLGALQSDEAKPYLEKFDIDIKDLSSMALIEDGEVYRRSTAALRIARRLKAPWPIFYAFILVPRFIRDAAYNWIARNRYDWFGKMESCRVPNDELRERFLS